LRIPAIVTAHSADRDRFSHNLSTGAFFVPRPVTMGQLPLGF